MSERMKLKIFFRGSAACLTVMASTILFMPMSAEMSVETGMWSLRIVGSVFWIFLALGYGLLLYSGKKFVHEEPTDRKIGFLNFFSSLPVKIADAAFLAAVAAGVMLKIAKVKSQYPAYVILFVLVLSLNFHGIFNGKIYEALKDKDEEEKEDENSQK